jgi:hypothetical protein
MDRDKQVGRDICVVGSQFLLVISKENYFSAQRSSYSSNAIIVENNRTDNKAYSFNEDKTETNFKQLRGARTRRFITALTTARHRFPS